MSRLLGEGTGLTVDEVDEVDEVRLDVVGVWVKVVEVEVTVSDVCRSKPGKSGLDGTSSRRW